MQWHPCCLRRKDHRLPVHASPHGTSLPGKGASSRAANSSGRSMMGDVSGIAMFIS